MDIRSDAAIVKGYSPFVDACHVAVRDFGAGEVEVHVSRASVYVQPSGMPSYSGVVASVKREPVRDPGPWDEAFDAEAFAQWRIERAARDAADAENAARAARRARQTVAHRIKAIGADRMLTLTYRVNMTDRARLVRDWQAFVRRMRRAGISMQYVAVAERQKRGAWHMHVALRGRQNYRLVRSIWRSVVGEGNIDVRNPFRQRALRHKLAAYMSKYVGKGFEAAEAKGARRVWCSEGIERPERVVTGYPWSGWQDAVALGAQLLPEGSEVCGWYQARHDLLVLVASRRC